MPSLYTDAGVCVCELCPPWGAEGDTLPFSSALGTARSREATLLPETRTPPPPVLRHQDLFLQLALETAWRLHLGWLASLLAWEPLFHASHLLRLILAGPQLRLQYTGHVSPSGANSSDSLTDHHPHCVTPPAAFDIQRLTWASRKLSALTL
ncbi:unnamed protein product [Rangifer tarandus platyrhynchus]|uniref:Uncharacterized protein n=1 Tax=Rangifer tarandus platyrhynchus TaxID=3082113 RepID=A0AC59YF77_RANTA